MKKIISNFCVTIALCTSLGAQSFFQLTPYRGAFGSDDWTDKWANWYPITSSYPTANITISGSITTNTTWTSNKTYLIKGYVYVKNGATLTIEPGTVVRFDVFTTSTLVITRGAYIHAAGTENQPIVFTSNEDAGYRNYGDWGGLVILGKAKVNIAGGNADVGAGINNSNGDGIYGGNDETDSSGVLRYVRIEFAGVQYQPDKEICGLTLGAVGNKTKIDHIQISFCGNDAYRCSGGDARLKNIISHRSYDNDFVADLGYKGLVQFGVFLRDSTKANASGSCGLEISNDGLASDQQPFTDPTFSNLTVLGPLTQLNTSYNNNYRYGLLVKNNARIGIFNSAFAGFPKGIVLHGKGCGTNVLFDNILIRNCLIAGSKTKHLDTAGGFAAGNAGFDFNTWFTDITQKGEFLPKPKDLMLLNPYAYNNPLFIPATGSPMLSGASFSHIRLSKTESIYDMQYSGLYVYSFDRNIHIKNENNYALKIAIYSATGQLLRSLNTSQNMHIWNPNLAAGIYYILVYNTKNQIIESIKMVN